MIEKNASNVGPDHEFILVNDHPIGVALAIDHLLYIFHAVSMSFFIHKIIIKTSTSYCPLVRRPLVDHWVE